MTLELNLSIVGSKVESQSRPPELLTYRTVEELINWCFKTVDLVTFSSKGKVIQ